jgi:uncharacterized damage-inducible protein DinB
MKLTQVLLDELNSEVERSRRVLKEVPEGKYDWKPHEKSMVFGYLADMVATISTWVTMKPARKETSAALLQALDKAAADARTALEKTTDDYLMTPWKLLAKGQVVMESPRHVVIRDTINHWAHHRGQMTVYLRLMGAKVPALYGPSADDNSFQ